MSIGVNGSVADALISIVIYYVRSYIYPIDLKDWLLNIYVILIVLCNFI